MNAFALTKSKRGAGARSPALRRTKRKRGSGAQKLKQRKR